VNHAWAICLKRTDAATLAAIRLTPGIEVAVAGDDVWIRGPAGGEALGKALLRLPATGRFERLSSNQLRRVDQRVPSERLPDGGWSPLSSWLQAALPVAALPGRLPPPAALSLGRSGDERDPDLLLTDIEGFAVFAGQAARVRLDRLEFAAAADGRVLIRGRPLPPIPGTRFVLHGQIAVPAGFIWRPTVIPEVLARGLGLARDALALWNDDNTITRLHREQFVRVTRSAVHATRRALGECA
jgi:hypothetical protein